MSIEYAVRREAADDVAKIIQNHAPQGVLIVGSVAYNPEAVTQESDLDLVGVMDFSKLNFEAFYDSLRQSFEPKIAEYASAGKINNFSIVWQAISFEIGLHLWDTGAFENVVKVERHNYVFARDKGLTTGFKSTATTETLRSLSGIEKKVHKEPKKAEGGAILPFFPYQREEREFYPGIQIFNLLLDPVILFEKERAITAGIKRLEENLKYILIQTYGEEHPAEINLLNALSPKYQQKLTKGLRERLRTFS